MDETCTAREPLLLRDGRRVVVRPIVDDDVEALQAMHLRLSPRTVQRRFFALMRELPLPQAQRFSHVDGVDRAALIAVAEGGDLVGVARYDREPGTSAAEFAIVVEDSYQHQGLGTALLRLLAEHAQQRGIDRFTADVLDENRPMFRTLLDAGLDVLDCTADHGVDHLVLDLAAHQAPVRCPGT